MTEKAGEMTELEKLRTEYQRWKKSGAGKKAAAGPSAGERDGAGAASGARSSAAADDGTANLTLPDLFIPGEKSLSADAYLQNLGFPGEYPFTRGVQPTMYRGRSWTMRQYSGFGTAQETNKRFHFLLGQGGTGMSVAFDLPTQMGRDSDHALAQGEVGRVGVAIDSIEDMEMLFDGIPLEKVSTSMTINATAHILLGLYLICARRRGISWQSLRGTVQNDVLKEYVARGTYIYPPQPALKIATDIFEFCRDEVPLWNTISISGYHIREAGSTAIQEVGLTLAHGIAYVEAAVARGLNVDSFAPRLAFFFNCHNGFLEEIAKFRAARRLWARIMRERFGAKDPKSMMMRFHTQTAGSSLTAQQPLLNMVRTTVQALAAVLGGTQSLHTNGYDEALCLPTEESASLALRTQQVLAHESGVAQVVDPFAGSYAVEELTDQIEAGARLVIGHIDTLGGAVRAIGEGYSQSLIEESAYRYQKGIEKGDIPVVGVNIFAEASDSHTAVPLLRIDPSVENAQIERLRRFREARNAPLLDQAMTVLKRAATEDTNLMPPVCEALDAGATLGEISDLLRGVYGEYGQRS